MRGGKQKEAHADIVGNGREVSSDTFKTQQAYLIAEVKTGPKAMLDRSIYITITDKNYDTIQQALLDFEDSK